MAYVAYSEPYDGELKGLASFLLAFIFFIINKTAILIYLIYN